MERPVSRRNIALVCLALSLGCCSSAAPSVRCRWRPFKLGAEGECRGELHGYAVEGRCMVRALLPSAATRTRR